MGVLRKEGTFELGGGGFLGDRGSDEVYLRRRNMIYLSKPDGLLLLAVLVLK